MKPTLGYKKSKLPSYRIDPELNKYDGVILFPEKVEKAKESIRKYGLPDIKKAMKEAEENQLLEKR